MIMFLLVTQGVISCHSESETSMSGVINNIFINLKYLKSTTMKNLFNLKHSYKKIKEINNDSSLTDNQKTTLSLKIFLPYFLLVLFVGFLYTTISSSPIPGWNISNSQDPYNKVTWTHQENVYLKTLGGGTVIVNRELNINRNGHGDYDYNMVTTTDDRLTGEQNTMSTKGKLQEEIRYGEWKFDGGWFGERKGYIEIPDDEWRDGPPSELYIHTWEDGKWKERMFIN